VPPATAVGTTKLPQQIQMNSPYNVPKLLQEHYHLTCTDFKSLEGYDSTNFKVTTDKGTYLLKIYQP
jgi:Ser/Thr protein kinase RdoA (MazF antagonist)